MVKSIDGELMRVMLDSFASVSRVCKVERQEEEEVEVLFSANGSL